MKEKTTFNREIQWLSPTDAPGNPLDVLEAEAKKKLERAHPDEIFVAFRDVPSVTGNSTTLATLDGESFDPVATGKTIWTANITVEKVEPVEEDWADE